MDAEFDKLLSAQWRFLHQDWPVVSQSRFHRTEIKKVENIKKVKDLVHHRLGYPGPYRNIEKGVLVLYMLLTGTPSSEMGEFMPKSSFHD
ncbi:hypothetical protein BGX21_007336, partial [Mortierella sp. AD011]